MELDFSQLKSQGWQQDNDVLRKTFVVADFMAAVDAVNKIARLAEAANHHPDIQIKNYKELTISLTTHSEGKITQKDIDLAKEIESFNF